MRIGGNGCPACSCREADAVDEGGTVLRCRDCEGIFTMPGRRIYLGDSYGYVRPRMTAEDVPPERLRYFDFDCLGSKGLLRRHGWFDTATRLIVQVG